MAEHRLGRHELRGDPVHLVLRADEALHEPRLPLGEVDRDVQVAGDLHEGILVFFMTV